MEETEDNASTSLTARLAGSWRDRERGEGVHGCWSNELASRRAPRRNRAGESLGKYSDVRR